MEYYRIIPDNKVAIVDAVQFEEIEQLSKLNAEEIENKAKELYKSYLKDTGIDIKIKYLTDKNILYNDLVRVDYGEEGYWISNNDPYQKQVRDKIVDSIIKDVNKQVYPIRKEIIEGITSNINNWKDICKRWFKIFIYSNIIWLIICVVLLGFIL